MFDFSYKKVSKKSSQSSRKAINVNSIFSFDTGRNEGCGKSDKSPFYSDCFQVNHHISPQVYKSVNNNNNDDKDGKNAKRHGEAMSNFHSNLLGSLYKYNVTAACIEEGPVTNKTANSMSDLNSEATSTSKEEGDFNMLHTETMPDCSVNVDEHFCGELSSICKHCSALHFKDEVNRQGAYKNCCHFGKVKLQEHHEYPEVLKGMFDNKDFKANIRSYNSALSFASLGAQVETITNGPYCLKIHGQVYHTTYNVNNVDENKPRKYAQLYVIDTDQANDIRTRNGANAACDFSVMSNLDRLIRSVNPYAQAYYNMAEVERQAKSNGTYKGNLSMVFNRSLNRTAKRYNAPTASEIAMIFTDNNGEPPFERDIKVYAKGVSTDNLQLNLLSPHLDPMTYVLFYPHGELGWQPNMILPSYNESMQKISMLQYKVAQISIQSNKFNPILSGGKLFQQWVVDSYLQVEANNLNYIKTNQKKLRVEQYKGLIDYLNIQTTEVVGRPVILPSTFQGSPRNMRERYHDAMSMVTKFGKPDLFITMTCNPNWKEIRDQLLPGQQPCDRPDLVARVFKLKLEALRTDIIKNKIFGNVKAHVYTIEFQKRGLPHAHMLFILEHKVDTVEMIDKIVSAEIPKTNEDERLHNLVMKHMIHGPCGSANPNAPCMENGICTKGFSKEFNTHTKITEGYPVYRRREGQWYNYKNTAINNIHVVPYNKYLLKKYKC